MLWNSVGNTPFVICEKTARGRLKGKEGVGEGSLRVLLNSTHPLTPLANSWIARGPIVVHCSIFIVSFHKFIHARSTYSVVPFQRCSTEK